jgi:hypothetical protein
MVGVVFVVEVEVGGRGRDGVCGSGTGSEQLGEAGGEESRWLLESSLLISSYFIGQSFVWMNSITLWRVQPSTYSAS